MAITMNEESYVMNDKLYIFLFVALLFVACSADEKVDGLQDKRKIEIAFSMPAYSVERMDGTGGTRLTRSTDEGTTVERQIDDLYLLLFKEDGTDPLTYYINAAGDFSYEGKEGNWNGTTNTVKLELTQSEAGTRQVYVVANCRADLKTKLDAVTTVTGTGETALQNVLRDVLHPWSPTLTTPILMSGKAMHNFITNYQLSNVALTRAVAKLQLNITLTAQRQGAPTINEGIPGDYTTVHPYKYKLVDFDKNTYVLKPAPTKTDALASSADWINWDAVGALSSYTLDGGGKVTTLSLSTYLNERDNAGTAVELQLPYYSGGTLPPPQFGNEGYKITLPTAVQRNHWYVYDVEI